MKQPETADWRPQTKASWRFAAGHDLPVIGGLATAGAYYLGVQVGIAFTVAPQPVSTLWPPNAILFGVLLLAAPRHWWIFILAVLPVHLSAQLTGGVSLPMSLLWFVSNVSEALIGAACIRHYVREPLMLDTLRQVALFLMFALLSTFLSSFLDVGFVALVGADVDYWGVWRTRFFSNVLAMVTVAPVVVTLGRIDLAELKRVPLRRYVEFAVLTVVLLVASAIVFNMRPEASTTFLVLYVLTPPLLWAALRFDTRIVSPLLLALAVIAMDAAVKGHGPFETGSLLDNVFAVQLFVLTAAVPILALAAVTQERSHALEVGQANEERLQLALGAAQMGTLDWDLGSDRVTLCDTSRSMLGMPNAPRTLPMTTYMRVVHPDDRAAVIDTLAGARARRSAYEVEFRVRLPGDRIRWIHALGKVIENSQGKEVRVLGVNIDVTQRKQSEKQEQDQRQQLAHMSRVAVMGELSGALAHELNQPLTSIMSNAEAAMLMIDGRRPDLREFREILTDIVGESRRASDVIGHMRNLLRKGEVKFQLLDVNDTIREVLALEYSELLAKGVSVQLDLAPDLPFIHADRVQVQQVLLNLIANARDAMSPRAVSDRVLTVCSASTADGGVEILVSDLGEGVPESQREAIFQPFFSTKSQGLGMGLAICRTIVNTHNGQLWITDHAPRGTTFHVLLPQAPASAVAQDLASVVLSADEMNDMLNASLPPARDGDRTRTDAGGSEDLTRKLH